MALVQLNGWTVKLRVPESDAPPPVILLIHGWTGDENSMWVFGTQMPSNALLIAPRAPNLSTHPKHGGYSWESDHSKDWSTLDDFRPSVAALDELLAGLSAQYAGDYSRLGLVGFSQGAAMAYAYALLRPERVRRLAALAGFAPEESEAEAAKGLLSGLPVFIAHGTRDDQVPIERAHQARALMEQVGANVEYCESDVEHKLGVNCFKALKEFWSDWS